jgi:mono/diheme cytochrome c family protein
MKKLAVLFVVAAVALLALVSASAALAQEEVPPEYAGMTNPFPWDDADAQEAGGAIYQKSCRGCHGADGSFVADYNFSTDEYVQRLEEKADLVYYVLTEGRINNGMPGYKASISDEGRWQLLNYMWALGTAPAGSLPGGPASPPDQGGALMMEDPPPAKAGEPFTITAFLMDSKFDPYAGATVKFYLKTEFFMEGWMEIGEAVTDDDGNAIADLTTRLSGDMEIAARYGQVESIKMISVAEPDGRFYEPEAGIHLPTVGEEVFLGPDSATVPSTIGEPPATGFRLPGGVLSWVLLLVAAVGLSWGTYIRVLFQVFRVSTNPAGSTTETRLVPLIGMVALGAVGIMLMLMLLTGPQSNFHLTH